MKHGVGLPLVSFLLYQYISDFWRKFHEMQILRVHISAYENAFDLKFLG